MRIELAAPSLIPRFRISVLVTKMSSPTSCLDLPTLSVSNFHPAQSSSAKPSSSEAMGYLASHPAQYSTSSAEVFEGRPDFLNVYLPSLNISLTAGSRQMETCTPGLY